MVRSEAWGIMGHRGTVWHSFSMFSWSLSKTCQGLSCGAKALILETTGHDSASSLGVALFALTSALSRIVVGILSDKYQAYFTRFHWLTAALTKRLES